MTKYNRSGGKTGHSEESGALKAVVDALQKLLDKQMATWPEALASAIENNSESYEEILRFIMEDNF